MFAHQAKETVRIAGEPAEIALRRYGLSGARLTPAVIEGDAGYIVEMPAGLGPLRHPYLGRVDGKRFLMKVRDSATVSVAASRAELLRLAALIRDTDEALPEPVPACDGALIVELPPADGTARHCVLLRPMQN